MQIFAFNLENFAHIKYQASDMLFDKIANIAMCPFEIVIYFVHTLNLSTNQLLLSWPFLIKIVKPSSLLELGQKEG